MEKQQLHDLLAKYLNRQTDEEELARLQAMMVADEEQEKVVTVLQEMMAAYDEPFNFQPEEWEDMRKQILATGRAITDIETPVRRMPTLRNWWVAASVILLIAAGAGWWMATSKQSADHVAIVQTDIGPGREGAVLTLADGSIVSLDSIQNGVVAIQGGATAKVVDGVLRYEGKGTELSYNTLSTPKGRQFHFVLPDGTEVWLNSASSIRYPATFAGPERRVEISGEVYFEIAANDRMPFRLNVRDKAEVEVLGTHFNVDAYANEENIRTTLVEGAVRVLNKQSAVVLRPGQQARIVNEGISVIENANIEKVLAWKHGLFNFKDATLEEVMRQLERWYDIDVVYENGVPDIALTGKITRGVTLKELLSALKAMGMQYRLDGRKLIIMQ